MTSARTWTLAEILELLEGDDRFLEEARRQGLHRDDDGDCYDVLQVERVRVARTLVRELDVNWPGVEVVLRLREELVHTRQLALELARRIPDRSDSDY